MVYWFTALCKDFRPTPSFKEKRKPEEETVSCCHTAGVSGSQGRCLRNLGPGSWDGGGGGGTQLGDFGKDWGGGSQGPGLDHAFCYVVVKSDDCDDDQCLHG